MPLFLLLHNTIGNSAHHIAHSKRIFFDSSPRASANPPPSLVVVSRYFQPGGIFDFFFLLFAFYTFYNIFAIAPHKHFRLWRKKNCQWGERRRIFLLHTHNVVRPQGTLCCCCCCESHTQTSNVLVFRPALECESVVAKSAVVQWQLLELSDRLVCVLPIVSVSQTKSFEKENVN